jgi:HYR domain-containing protein/type IX secretion system substrate protein
MNPLYTMKPAVFAFFTAAFLLLTAGSNLHAQTNFGAFQDNNYFNANNWNNGLPGPGNDGTVVGGVTAVLNAPLDINFTLTNYGTLTTSAPVTVNGTLNNYTGSTFNINAGGSLTNNGTMDQRSTINIAAGTSFTNAAGAAYSTTGTGTIENNGSLSIGGTFNNLGTINNYSAMECNGGSFGNNTALNNYGTFDFKGGTLTNVNGANITNAAGGQINHTSGAVLNNLGGGTVTNLGTYSNTGDVTSNGVIVNEGLFNNNAGGYFENFFVVNNHGTFNNNNQGSILNEHFFNNDGTFNNNAFLDNGSALNNLAGGNFINTVGGTLNNQFGSTIANDYIFSNTGTISSVGDIVNTATFTNDGTITTNSGGGLINSGNFTNNQELTNFEEITNNGIFTNNGPLQNASGGWFINNGDLYNNQPARISNDSQLENNQNLYNAGTIENGVRIFNNDYFENSGYLINIEDFDNNPTGTFDNTATGVLDNNNGGVFTNIGTLNNHNEVFNSACSSFANKGIINNYYTFANHSIFFNKGEFNALPNNFVNLDGGVTVTDTSSSQVCEAIGVNLDAQGLAMVTGSALSIAIFDNCEAFDLRVNYVPDFTYTCGNIGPNSAILILTDRKGNAVSCLNTITVVDDMGPVFSNCPADIVITTNEPSAPANWTPPAATGNCGTATVATTHEPGSGFPQGTTQVTYSATDASGNGAAHCNFNVSVVAAGDCGDVTAIRQVTSTHDNCGNWCGGEYAFTYGSGHCFTAGPDLTFIEYAGGTAQLVGSIYQDDDRAYVDVHFEGRTTTAPAGSPKLELCVEQGGSDWTYYPGLEGSITDEDGHVHPIVRYGPAFQIGIGGNLQDPGMLGASGWISADNGATQAGNFNFRLSEPLPCTNSISLEAECADATGNNWTLMNDPSASGGKFLLPPNKNSYNYPPVGTADIVRFNVNVTGTAAYRIFARTQNENGASDSYWVRVNNGNWVKWNKINAGSYSSQFQWDQVGEWRGDDIAIPMTFQLNAGTNKIEISWREANARLDKLFITQAGTMPGGMGPLASNCDPGTPPPACEEVTISIKPDYYGSDITWNLKNESGNILTSGGPYWDGNTSLQTATICLTDGCYKFNIYDSYGDGICCSYGDGGYSIKNSNGELLASNGDYNSSESKTFCLGDVPPPACNKNALLVAGSSNLNTSDNAVKQRLEELGFSVTTANDDYVKTSDSDGKGLIVISSTISSDKVGNKFRAVAVPVIVWEAWLFDNMKMTGTTSNYHYGASGGVRKMTINDPAHPIAQGATGKLEVLSSNQTVTWGNPGDGASRIGYIPGNPTRVMLFAYDTGAEMVGMTAPARRVGFFLHNATAQKLRTAGWQLFDRSVQWATGCDLGVAAGASSEVLSLKAAKEDRHINLYWTNNTGYKNEFFILEKSTDGVNFEVMNEMYAYQEEDNSTNLFEDYDYEPAIGPNYYRVKVLHIDGSISESEVKVVEMNPIGHLALYPNPASTYTKINLEDMQGETGLTIQVNDIFGRMVETIELDEVYEPWFWLSLNGYQTGRYIVTVIPQGKRPVAQKLIISK